MTGKAPDTAAAQQLVQQAVSSGAGVAQLAEVHRCPGR